MAGHVLETIHATVKAYGSRLIELGPIKFEKCIEAVLIFEKYVGATYGHHLAGFQMFERTATSSSAAAPHLVVHEPGRRIGTPEQGIWETSIDGLEVGEGRGNPQRGKTTGGVCLDDDKIGRMGFRTPPDHQEQAVGFQRRKNIPTVVQFGYGRSGFEGYLGNVE